MSLHPAYNILFSPHNIHDLQLKQYAGCYSIISLAMDIFAFSKQAKKHHIENRAGEPVDFKCTKNTFAVTALGALLQAHWLYPSDIPNADVPTWIVLKEQEKQIAAKILMHIIASNFDLGCTSLRENNRLDMEALSWNYSREEILFIFKKAKYFCITKMGERKELISDRKITVFVANLAKGKPAI